MNGMKNEIVMESLRKVIEEEKLEVLFVTEAFLSTEREQEMKSVFSQYDVHSRPRKVKEKNKNYQKRGGVVCIAKKDTVKIERETECDDMMWIEWRGMSVVCAYFVPPNSPFEKRNEKRMIELQQRVLESRGKVMILTDANAWIGERPSTLTGDGRTREFVRRSEKREENKQGEWFMSAMNSIDMVILNGVREEIARCTYDHPGKEAKSVIDFVVVKEEMMSIVSELKYVDCREKLETDHILIKVDVESEEVAPLIAQRRPKKKVKKVKKKKKSPMEMLKRVTRKDPFWKTFEECCNVSLSNYSPVVGQEVDRDYEEMKARIAEALNKAMALTPPSHKKLTASIRCSSELKRLRKKKSELFAKMRDADQEQSRVVKRELCRVSNLLKRRTRTAVNKYKREQVAEIEGLEPDDCRRMWKELKTLSGWTRRETTPETMLNESKEEVSGDEVKEVWKEAFRVLGIENESDEKFDVEYGREVSREQEEILDNSYLPSSVNVELDTPISYAETSAAILRLKLGKAAGVDEVVAEVIVKGGELVTNAIHLLCEKVWTEEKVPTEWTKGIIFPIYKDGEKKETGNYRGITLLSIVGKVYAQILNERLMRWTEKNKVLVEEQGGFRPHRGCPDQLFTLVEILKNRGKEPTFCCFIDVKKAFDRVFRNGLWKRLADEGVKGKMWRVLRSIYESVESCVRVDDELTEFFSIETGVRQGCVLSPLLYAIFINGLVKELKELNCGIEIGENQELNISSLLYADDIVLMAEDRYTLQLLMNTVANYAKRWKFELNPKKSEVVVFGSKRAPRDIEWRLGENVIKQVTKYKYLGIELTRTLNWSPYLKRILKKAKRNMTQSLAMGIKGGFMTIRLANTIWTSLVRSIVEYGCEIWGDRPVPDLEKLQLQMGKRILRCGKKMTEEVVRGELGWERQKSRGDEMRLRYWSKIVKMTDDRIVKRIYRVSRNRMEREESERIPITSTWCKYTRDLMMKLNLEEEWYTEEVGTEEEWNHKIRERIHEREERKWRNKCLLRPKLRTYVKLKRKLKREVYLQIYHRGGVPEMVKMRGGTNRLRIEQGRYRGEEVEERVCEYCDMGEIEDEDHFMRKCKLYEDLREKMWRDFEEITEVKQNEVNDELNALIGDEFQPTQDEDPRSQRTTAYRQLTRRVMEYITVSMKRRRDRIL